MHLSFRDRTLPSEHRDLKVNSPPSKTSQFRVKISQDILKISIKLELVQLGLDLSTLKRTNIYSYFYNNPIYLAHIIKFVRS